MEPTKNTLQLIAEIYEEMSPILKTGENKEQGYSFIEQAAIMAAIRSLFAKKGLVLMTTFNGAPIQTETISKTGSKGTHTLVAMNFVIVQAGNPADKVEYGVWYGESKDSSDKGLNKATTSAQKYFLVRNFLISDVDPDVFDMEQAPKERPQKGGRHKPEKQLPATGGIDWEGFVIYLPASKKGLHGKKLGSLQDAQLEALRDGWLPNVDLTKAGAKDRALAAHLRLALASRGLNGGEDGPVEKLMREIDNHRIPADEFLKAAIVEGWITEPINSLAEIPLERAEWMLKHLKECLDQIDIPTEQEPKQ